MGWWVIRGDNGVIGDGPADYLEELMELGLRWDDSSKLPAEIRERLSGFWLQEFGRPASTVELQALLRFCRGEGGGPLERFKG